MCSVMFISSCCTNGTRRLFGYFSRLIDLYKSWILGVLYIVGSFE
jgi:hypothetical protein